MKQSTKDGLTNLAVGVVAGVAAYFCIKGMFNAQEVLENTESLRTGLTKMKQFGSLLGALANSFVSLVYFSHLTYNLKGYTNQDIERLM